MGIFDIFKIPPSPKSVGEQVMRAAKFNEDNLSKAMYRKGVCPDCGCSEFNPGPSGGLSQNIRCSSCGAKFNLGPPFEPERINNSDEVYNLNTTFNLKKALEV